jgi:hypothetical protein
MLINIQNLPYRIPVRDVWKLCSRYGRVSSVQVFSAYDSNHPPGAWAMIVIDDVGGWRAIKSLNGGSYEGFILNLRAA